MTKVPVRADEIAMDGLNEWGPTIVGAGLLAYVWYPYFCIKREQARDRAEEEAAE